MSVVVGLTGGIGSGKSTVASLLSARGAAVVDADAAAREVLERGTPAAARVRERFGEGIVAPDGSLDRAALAAVVFSDSVARADLEAIVHPAVHDLMLERAAVHAEQKAVVVLDIPLLAEAGRDSYPLDGVLVVDCPIAVAVERLVADRHMTREDALARTRAQVDRAERLRLADFVILNVGTLSELDAMVGRAWEWIERLAEDS